jgi:Ca-activated chloride channel family protein
MIFLSHPVLWALLIAPALVVAYVALASRNTQAMRFPSLSAVRAAGTAKTLWRRHLPPALLFFGVLFLILAAARPASTVTTLAAKRTIVLTMDVSLSMAATDVKPSRLAAAQAAARAFIKSQPSDVSVGIVSFAGTADLVQRPTTDRDALNAAIARLRLDYHTAIGTGIIAALVTLFPDAGLERNFDIFGSNFGADRFRPARHNSLPEAKGTSRPTAPGSYPGGAIILLTDGSRTMGPDPLEAARMAASRGVRVYTVGVGTPRTARVDVDGWMMEVGFDEPGLKEIAEITHADYFRADSAEALHRIYRTLGAELVVERQTTEVTALFTAAGAALSLVAGLLSLLWNHRATFRTL